MAVLLFCIQGINQLIHLEYSEEAPAEHRILKLFPERLGKPGKDLGSPNDMYPLLPLLRDSIKDAAVHLLGFQAIKFQRHLVDQED